MPHCHNSCSKWLQHQQFISGKLTQLELWQLFLKRLATEKVLFCPSKSTILHTIHRKNVEEYECKGSNAFWKAAILPRAKAQQTNKQTQQSNATIIM